jgi:transcriptional regulator with XRE-family HTH domain
MTQEKDQEIKDRIARIMRKRRTELLLTQTELAKRIGMSLKRLSNAENGKDGLTATEWFYFCEVTKTSPDIIMYYDAGKL